MGIVEESRIVIVWIGKDIALEKCGIKEADIRKGMDSQRISIM